MLIGDKGRLVAAGPYGESPRLFGPDGAQDIVWPEPFLPRPGGHHKEWGDACRTGAPTGSNFAYAVPLTEIALLGMAAFRVGHKLHWDRATMKALNCAEADRYTRREYRQGWTL